ncbi:transferase [Coniella lustricola]|uniref:Transferase n=1 Tax=Coniella lustricola TaxID=2025994 RepID=A0A2T3A8R7_9PEZI|nr:transferase [Coniella lustricola]
MGADDGQSEQSLPACRVISTKRVFPATEAEPNSAKSNKLSIIDATAARFASCAAVWLYDAGPTSDSLDALANNLENSLRLTLDNFRLFAGSLSWAPVDTRNASCPKYGRPVITWDAATDPGVEFVRAAFNAELSSLVPSESERKTSEKVWLATEFPQDDLLPKCELAFVPHLFRFEGLPVASVQVTRFTCGGWALGVKFTHCLSDAITLINFVKAWAEQSRIVMRRTRGTSSPSFESGNTKSTLLLSQSETPVFDPSLLERHACISNDTEKPDCNRIALARSLPLHRFDWWAKDAPGYPSWATADSDATKPSDAELSKIELSPSTPPPWPSWDASKPVICVQIRFTAAEVARLKKIAQAAQVETGAVRIVSRLDALLAHLWTQINRARGLHASDETVYLLLTLGLRKRVNPPLSDGFVGSPILIAHVDGSGKEISADDQNSNSNLGDIVRRMRNTMAQFTPQAVGAYMYDAAHEVCPQRLWQAFVGSRFVLVTSWARAGAYDVDFGEDQGRPRYVHARMPRMDGTLQVMDIGDSGDFDVSLALAEEDMRRLLAVDGGLWAF